MTEMRGIKMECPIKSDISILRKEKKKMKNYLFSD